VNFHDFPHCLKGIAMIKCKVFPVLSKKSVAPAGNLSRNTRNVQSDSKFVGLSVAYNFQTGSSKLKLLVQYGSITQKVLLLPG
jgi:hypothetical protein